MKFRRLLLLFVFIFMIPRLWTCDKYVSALEDSLLWKYYEGPHNWAGIILGTSTAEETLEILQSMDDFEMESIFVRQMSTSQGLTIW